MKKKLNLFFATSLIIGSTLSTLALIHSPYQFTSENLIPSKIINSDIDAKMALRYANETSIIPKALIVSSNKGFSTNKLLNNMYNMYSKDQQADFKNFSAVDNDNTGNNFINNWTQDLDGNSIKNIQTMFQRVGINQTMVDNIDQKIKNYANYVSSVSNSKAIIDKYLNNSTLANRYIYNLVDALLKKAKVKVPNIDTYLKYSDYLPLGINAIKNLVQDWDQESAFTGATTIDKMQDYMSKKATFAQGWKNYKNNGNWYYVCEQAKKDHWSWNDFYQYIAGANFNYLFSLVPNGQYMGDMLTDNISLFSGFNETNFMTTFTNALNQILVTPAATTALINAIIPIVKSNILQTQLTHCTLGINTLTWNNNQPINNNQLGLKQVLLEIQTLLTPTKTSSGLVYDKLINLVTKLLKGPFGTDIIVKLYPIGTTTCWTLPELLATGSKFSSSISAQAIASKIVGKTATGIPNILKLINTFFDFTNKYLTTNPVIDLKDLSFYLTLTFGSDAFNQALVRIKNMIDFPNTTTYTGKSILELLGVEFKKSNFKSGSVLASLVTWIKTPNSSLNQLFNVIKGNNQQTGIITNMIKEQMQLYENLYSKYYDLNNNQYFKLSNIKMKKYHHFNGKISTILSYQIIDAIDNFTYNLTFNNDNFQKNNEFKLTSFHFQP